MTLPRDGSGIAVAEHQEQRSSVTVEFPPRLRDGETKPAAEGGRPEDVGLNEERGYGAAQAKTA